MPNEKEKKEIKPEEIEITEEEKKEFFDILKNLRESELAKTPVQKKEEEDQFYEKNLALLLPEDRADLEEEEKRLQDAGLTIEQARENSIKRLKDKVEGFQDSRFEMLNKVGMRRVLFREIRDLFITKKDLTEEDLEKVIVLRSDLNNLRFANDFGGHDTGGDFYLHEAANILKKGETVSKLNENPRIDRFIPTHESGDEFGALLLLKEKMEAEDLDQIASSLKNEIEQIDTTKIPFKIPDSIKMSENYKEGEQNFVASMSVGMVSLKEILPLLIKEREKLKTLDDIAERAVDRMFQMADDRANFDKEAMKREWFKSEDRAKRFTAEIGRPPVTLGEIKRMESQIVSQAKIIEELKSRIAALEAEVEERIRKEMK